MSDFPKITNKSFSMSPVDGSAPDWRIEQSFLDLCFELDGTEYSLRITWPSRATISTLVNEGMNKIHPAIFDALIAPTFTFPTTDAFRALQPMIDEIIAVHPDEPEGCRPILEHYGFEDTIWWFFPRPWRSELVKGE